MGVPVAVRALLFTLVAPSTVVGLVPWWLMQRWPGATSGFPLELRSDAGLTLESLRHAGWLFVAAGAAGYLLCVRDFVVRGRGTPNPLDPPRRFVASGLYRHVRNPMYVSIGLVLAGESLLLEAPALLAYLVALWITFHGFVTLYEEPHLQRVFGQEYACYRAAVPRWLVRLHAGPSARSVPSCTPSQDGDR